MPMTSELDLDSLILTFELSGDFGMDEIERIQSVTQEHFRTTGLNGVLLDVRNATPGGLKSGPIRMAAGRAQGFEATQQLKMAIIATSDVAFGYSRMYELLRGDDGGVRVYRELGPALEWLGGDSPDD